MKLFLKLFYSLSNTLRKFLHQIHIYPLMIDKVPILYISYKVPSLRLSRFSLKIDGRLRVIMAPTTTNTIAQLIKAEFNEVINHFSGS